MDDFDVVVLGAGIAGCSVAAHVAEHCSVLVLETEDQPGYHTTGRSAALFLLTYGNETVRSLTRASRDFFYAPPESFSGALVKPRTLLVAAREGQQEKLDAMLGSLASGDRFSVVSPEQAKAFCPILRLDGLASGAYCDTCADIEVHELLQGYTRRLKANGGEIRFGSKVLEIEHGSGRWTIVTPHGTVRAEKVVNAAGAWAEDLAKLADASELGLAPLKRTACLFHPPPGARSADWPMLADVQDQFYLKPDAGMLLLSPADETPSPPCDAQADELDVAIAIDRIEHATTLQVRRITHKWAGLRTFASDRSPVVGWDPAQPALFWLAALGGFGIQTAPALSRLAAALVLDRQMDDDLLGCGLDISAIAPARLLAATLLGEHGLSAAPNSVALPPQAGGAS